MNTFKRFIYGIVLKPVTTDPTDNVEGSLWVNSTSNRIKSYVQGAVREVVTTNQTQTLTNKTISGATLTVLDTMFTIQDDSDPTKQATFQASGITSGQTRNYAFPDASVTLVGADNTQTLANKSLADTTTNIVDNSDPTKKIAFDASGSTGTTTTVTSSQTANRVVTLPDATDTLVGKATTDVLTNKTIDGDDNTVQDLALTSLKTNLTDASKFLERNASGVVISSTHAVPTGVVVGTTDTQTLTNKSLTAPIVTDYAELTEQGSSPATPTSGKTRLYSKSDNFLYYKTDAGAEVKLQGGTGGINYVTNPDFEGGVTGYVAYADAAASRPVDGTGGSPTVTITASSSAPLRGLQSGLITKDAANRQGEGVSYDFTIDSADQAKVLNISIDYTIASGTYSGGTSSTDSDLIGYIYDVTNARLIEPAPFKLDGAVVGTNYTYTSSFQASSNSTAYRLIFHVATTSASAWVFKLDNVAVGPVHIVNGTPVTDAIAFTPTGSWTTNTTYLGEWTRVGDRMVIDYQVNLSGAPTSASLTLNLPSGYSIDTAKLTSTQALGNFLKGNGSAFDSSASSITPVYVQYFSTTSVLLRYGDDVPGYIEAGLSVDQVDPWVFASGDKIFAHVDVPILGWSSNVQMSSDTDTRVVAANLTNSSTSITTSATIPVFTTVNEDSHGAYSTSTGRYTVPVAGRYNIFGYIQASAGVSFNAGDRIKVELRQNTVVKGGIIGGWTAQTTATHLPRFTFNGEWNLNAGDLFDIVITSQTSSFTMDAGNVSLVIERLSGPSQVASSETVACRATSSSGQSINNNTFTTVDFNATVFDTHGAFNLTSNLFTAPMSGKYRVGCKLMYTSGGGWGAGEQATHKIVKNASTTLAILAEDFQQAAHTTFVSNFGSAVVDLVAGDTIEIQTLQNSGAALALHNDANSTYIDIERIK